MSKYVVLSRYSQGTTCVQSRLSSDILDFHPPQSFEMMAIGPSEFTDLFLNHLSPPTYLLSV